MVFFFSAFFRKEKEKKNEIFYFGIYEKPHRLV